MANPGSIEWLRTERETVRADAIDTVSRVRMEMGYLSAPGYRRLPVIEPLPGMTGPPASTMPAPPVFNQRPSEETS